MHVDFLLERMGAEAAAEALVWRDESFSYGWLCERVERWRAQLAADGVAPGSVVALEADYSPNAIALFLALVERSAIVVPLTSAVAAKRPGFLATAEVELSLAVGDDDEVALERPGARAEHPLYATLRERGHPGLVLFSSGSTGESKAAVHDLVLLLEKFRERRRAWRTLSFLLYDHIGGVNTLLYALSNCGTLVTVADRRPESVLRAIERQRVQLLPTSPTFLNLVLLSRAWEGRDLSSLELVTYGTEPMLASTLRRFHELLPHVRLLQTYGLSEVGILRSKSKSSDSLWVQVGGEGFETRVVDGILHVRARSAMLGYLNAPSPFSADGWLVTGDRVEVDGEYLRILGRVTDIVNVGGEKVYPAEVESVIQELDEVAEVACFGVENRILGQIVCARVTPRAPLAALDQAAFAARVKRHCRARLEAFKVPAKVELVDAAQHGARFKKLRAPQEDGG